jgi:hypothetical protein
LIRPGADQLRPGLEDSGHGDAQVVIFCERRANSACSCSSAKIRHQAISPRDSVAIGASDLSPRNPAGGG